MSEALLTTVREILALAPTRRLRVLVDGRSAAGKTTFAGILAARLREGSRSVVLVHFDEFHPAGYRTGGGSANYTPQTYPDEGYDFAAFDQMVLAPSAPGGSGRLGISLEDRSQTAQLATDGILVVDGCFLGKPALRRLWDYMIWIEVSFAAMVERAAVRDTAWVGDEARVRRRYEGFWRETHLHYERLGPRESADAIIDNEDWSGPRLIRP